MPYLVYISGLLVFGTNGVVASKIDLTSYHIVFLRSLIASVFLLAILLLQRKKLNLFANKKHLFYLALSGFAMGADWMCLYEAYNLVGVSIATLITYMAPAIVLALSPIMLGEKLTVLKCAVFAVVMLGMFLVSGGASGMLSWGLLYAVGAAVMCALMIIFNKKASSISGLKNATFQLVFALAVVAGFTFVKEGTLAVYVPDGSWLPMLFLGVVNTGLGCYLYFSQIAKIPASFVAICGYLEPLSAVAFSAIFLGERMTMLQWAGAALIIGGAVFYTIFTMRRPNCI